MENQNEFIRMIIIRLKDLTTEIRELEAMADKTTTELKAEYQKQINELFLKKEELKEEVSVIKKSTGNVWEDMKAGTELSWEAYEESVNKKLKKKK